MEGWIKLHRKILEDALWHNCTPEQKVILITILLLANHQPNEWIWKGKKCSVSPGQFITSTESLRAKCGKGITTKAIRNALAKFKKFGFVAIEGASDGTKLTVCKWDSYQRIEDERGKPSGKQGASDGQAMGKAGATNKNYKNEKELKEGEEPPENLWETWWNLYDIKQDEMKAQVYWSKITQEEKQKAIAHTREFIKVTPKPYRGNPVGYIQGKKWNNEIIDRRNPKEIQDVQPKRAPKKTHYSAQELDYYRKMGKTPPPLN